MAGEIPDPEHRHHADDAVMRLDVDGVVVGWSRAAEAFFGWSAGEVVGRPLTDVIVAPEDGARLLATIAHTAEQTPPRRVELAARCRDGRRLPVELTVVAGGEQVAGLTVVARDLTAVHEARSAQRQLAAITQACDEAIIVETSQGTISTWSRGAERVFGWPAEEVVGEPASLLVPAALVDEVAAMRERVRLGESVRGHAIRRLHRDGTALAVTVAVVPVTDDLGAVTGLVTTAHPVAAQPASPTDEGADAVVQPGADRALRTALDEARRSEDRARTFLADAAHQLRRPVTGMQACAEALLTGPPQPKREWLLASMVRETARAGRLITMLLQMARLDQGEHVQPEPCDVVGLCTDEVDRLYSLAPHLDLVIRADAVQEPRPPLDANAIREILSNLLDNARRYAVSRITVAVSVTAEAVEIRVTDDGPGLDPETAEAAFARFRTMDDRGGSGLGLPVARGYARAHGGDLTYQDRAFVLRLPTATDPTAKDGPPTG